MEARYEEAIVLNPDSFAWRNDVQGAAIKELSTFGNRGLALRFAKVSAGVTGKFSREDPPVDAYRSAFLHLPVRRPTCSELRILGKDSLLREREENATR